MSAEFSPPELVMLWSAGPFGYTTQECRVFFRFWGFLVIFLGRGLCGLMPEVLIVIWLDPHVSSTEPCHRSVGCFV